MQPHLTGLLPQQSKKVSDPQPLNKYNTSKGSISANMNANYFSSDKSYPEPKIIEYDMEEKSTESSPQHTSLYPESTTDQDSESIHPSNAFLSKNMECHVTKESSTIISSSQDFPVPSQFADLSLNKDDVDDHQHSILHSAYNQDDDIEDIPLSDNINQNEIEHTLENHESLESQLNEQGFDASKVQTFDCYSNKKDFGQTEFQYENKQSQIPTFNSNANYSSYNVDPLNVQNSSHSVKEFYLNRSNTLTQSNSHNSSISQPKSSLPLPYDNTEPKQKSTTVTNCNENLQSTDYNSQNKHVQPAFHNLNVPLTNSNLNPGIVNSNTQVLNQSTSLDQTLNDHNSCESMQSSINKIHYPQNVQNIESMHNSSKSSASEFLDNSKSINYQQSTAYTPSLTSTQSIITTPTERNISSVPEEKIEEIKNNFFQKSDDQTTSFNSSNAAINNSTDLVEKDSANITQSEFNDKPLQSLSNNIFENQQNNVNSSTPTPIVNLNQPNNNLNRTDTISEQGLNYQQSSQNQFISQQSIFDDNSKPPIDLVSNTVNKQNSTVQQSKQISGHSTSNYFDSMNTNNKSVFSQHENIYLRNIKPVVSNFSSSSKTNEVAFSNLQNNATNFVSSNQQPSLIENKLKVTDGLKLDSNVLLKETIELNSEKSIQLQPNDSHSNSIKSTDNIPIDTFSNMTINNQQDLPINQLMNRVQLTSASYFSNETFNKKENVSHSENLSSKLLEVNNIPQLANKQMESLFLNPNQSVPLQIPQSPSNNSTELDVQTIVQPAANPIPPQEFDNKLTENISSNTNQFLPQMFNNKPKLETVSPPNVISNSYSTQSVHNQQTSTTVPIVNQCGPQLFTSQQKPDTVSSLQQSSNPYSTQLINNQPAPTVVPNVPVTQFPPQMFNNQLKSDSVSAVQPSTNLYYTQPIHDQQTPNEVLPIIQSPPQIYSNQPKSVIMPSPLQNTSDHYSTKSVSNQLTAQSASSAINQFPPQTFNDQAKLNTKAHSQQASNQYPHSFSNQPSVNSVPSKLSTGSQLPAQMLSNNSKSDVVQTTPSIFSTQLFNNQLRSNMAPPVPVTVNQLPSQMLSNQPKAHGIPSLQSSQYQSQPYNSQPQTNMVPSVSSTSHQFPQQMFSNQPILDTSISNKITANRYPSQPLNNHPVLGVSSIQKSTAQYPSQPFNNQSKANVFPPSQTGTNQYPPQQSPSNQIYTQTNSTRPAHNQWPPHPNINQSKLQLTTPISNTNFSNQSSPMFSQPTMNSSSNLPSMPPSINQQSQRLVSQVYPSNTSNNYYNQSQEIENVQQSQPTTTLQGQNVQLPPKGYPLQSNTSLSNQINYQQLNTNLGQQGFYNQQQDPYKTEQNSSVQQGFAKTWVSLLLFTV